MNANAYLAHCCDGSIRIFANKKFADAWDRWPESKIREGMPISIGEVAKHWRGSIPRHGAVFTAQDISYGQLMATIANA